MKLFKSGKKSIQVRLWSAMLLTIAILVVLFAALNFTVLSEVRDGIYFEQLENAAQIRNNKLEDGKIYDDNNETASSLIAYFSVDFNRGEKNVTMDRFTSILYNKKDLVNVIPSILDKVDKSTPDNYKSSLRINRIDYYYYVSWIEADSAQIFIIPNTDDRKTDIIRFAVLFLCLIIISFFTSSYSAKKLSKPIKELENFADEIAHRNWLARVPKTDPDEIGRLAKSLEAMRDSLEIAEDRDRQFLQSSSHDLKTPVMVIKGYAQAMIDGVHVESSDSAATIIMNEAEKLERRILQLLRLNTLGHSLEYTNERDFVRVDRIINRLVERCGVINPSINWELSLESLEIMGDSEALVIAFENIFENQLRYAKSVISVQVDSKNMRVTIDNDGPPFTVDDPMILFDSYKKDEEGKFGLGLAIVWKVLKAHNSSIKALNIPTGVSFIIEFNKG